MERLTVDLWELFHEELVVNGPSLSLVEVLEEHLEL